MRHTLSQSDLFKRRFRQLPAFFLADAAVNERQLYIFQRRQIRDQVKACLLYTSDAADE